jgi:EAL domain-containing protein (putative c-di-GMP-specific phosphodiesterase class I)
VNVDVRSLLDDSFADEVANALARHELDPELLRLEITEGTVMTEPDTVAGVAKRLQELGVRLALDDFGSGFSSLAYVQHLPIAELKIDRSFVLSLTSDPTVEPIVRSIVALGRSLDLRVVAEGIETAELLRAIRDLNCALGQGFHLSEPLSPDELWERIQAPVAEPAAA